MLNHLLNKLESIHYMQVVAVRKLVDCSLQGPVTRRSGCNEDDRSYSHEIRMPALPWS
jgi:hypothetical protein